MSLPVGGPLAILAFVGILIVLVIIHELGHMVVAKWCGMRVERFSVFFGRPIASFQRGETEYAIGWLPLGGYVKISGMTRGEEIPPEVEPRAYYSAAPWRKIATILAGPAVNIVLAFVLFCAVFWIGIPTFEQVNRVAGVQQDSPAEVIGLQPGDSIVAVGGVATDTPEELRDQIEPRAGQSTAITIERDGREIERTATIGSADVDGEVVGRLGFTFDAVQGPTQRFGPIEGVERGWDFTSFVVEENVRVIGESFTSSEARGQVNSVVGVGAVFTEISGDGLVTILRFIALVSLALGIFNLLPILPLDGGHIVFALIEWVKGGPVPRGVYEKASMVGFAIIMLVFVVALQNDIGRLTGEGFQVQP